DNPAANFMVVRQERTSSKFGLLPLFRRVFTRHCRCEYQWFPFDFQKRIARHCANRKAGAHGNCRAARHREPVV
ncbi:hypothetical protein, partial [Pseudomonas sp. GW460-13]|uniref:hypothetical protein n=1 Tax=Pseudomonas sp. GW460-13 TaxID=2070590 RepID=UPI001C45B19F